jgi:hypothetical protein
MRRLRLELWRQEIWLLHQDNAPLHTSFLTKEFFAISTLPFSVSPIEDKIERPPF